MSAPVRCVPVVGSLLQGHLLTFVVSCVLLNFFVQTGNQHIYQPVVKQGNITLQVPEHTTTHTHKYSCLNLLNCTWIIVNEQITYNSIILHPLSDSCLQNTVYSCDNTFNCTLSDSKTPVDCDQGSKGKKYFSLFLVELLIKRTFKPPVLQTALPDAILLSSSYACIFITGMLITPL